MSYFIFLKNLDNIEGTIYKIAENESDLNNLNIIQSDYKIIQDSQENFNDVKLNIKGASKYNGDVIIFNTIQHLYDNISLKKQVENLLSIIKPFLNNNPNHSSFNQWNNYYNQLNNLNLDNINYPLTISLEQYFNALGQSFLNPLQIP